jgi:hypothetical protein
MQLIGMLDSPYVRRVAISMRLMEIPFTHRAVSVFRHLAEFQSINPVVKAPTLILDDGSTLMDSTLILDYLDTGIQSAASCRRPCTTSALSVPAGTGACRHGKSVQLVYEQQLRPEDKRHLPWQERVASQLTAAYSALEQAMTAAARYQQPGSGRYQHCRRLALHRELLPQQLHWHDYPACNNGALRLKHYRLHCHTL